MKYIVIGFEGFIFSVAFHLQQEGCDVLVGQVMKSMEGREDSEEKKRRLLIYHNCIEKYSIEELLKKLQDVSQPSEYFVICESNTMYPYAKQLQKLGFHGIFPTKQDRLFEIDRNFSKEFVRKYYPELHVAENKKFFKITGAQAFLKQTKKLWVLKAQTDDLATFVPQTDNPSLAKKQILENLEVYRRAYESAGFLLEEKIPHIIEVTPEKYYYNGIPLGMVIDCENKFIGSGNLSYQVTCAGDTVFPLSMKSKIHDICFPPIVDQMAKQHKGLFIWDASVLINRKSGDIYFGEFCPNRFGFNSFLTILGQMPSASYFFEQVSQEKNPLVPGTVGTSLMLFNLLRNPRTNAILSDVMIAFPKKTEKHIWLYDSYRKKRGGHYYTSGYDTNIGPVTGSAHTFQQSVNQMYQHARSVVMNEVYYRPKFDYVSTDYETAILNRLDYCVKQNLFTLPFALS